MTLYLGWNSDARVLGVDKISNSRLSKIPGYVSLEVDLNPLNRANYVEEFSADLQRAITSLLPQMEAVGVNCLIQSAGVYDSGFFLEHDAKRRQRVIGVNFIGHLEVLYNVMALNGTRGINNATFLTYIDIGSFQGLYARAQRPLYAPSKAVGIDLCTALWEGRELHRCIYFAPALVDTHMLHENHWVKKAGGSHEFFRIMFEGSIHEYRAVFIERDVTVLRKAASVASIDIEEIHQAFERYCCVRDQAFETSPGVIGAAECAEMLIKIVMNPHQYPSGVYFADSMPGEGTALRWTSFSELSRADLFARIGRRLL